MERLVASDIAATSHQKRTLWLPTEDANNEDGYVDIARFSRCDSIELRRAVESTPASVYTTSSHRSPLVSGVMLFV